MCNCPICVALSKAQPTVAEIYLDNARIILHHPGIAIVDTEGKATEQDHRKAMNRVDAAIRLYYSPILVRFRAIAEDWTEKEIIENVRGI